MSQDDSRFELSRRKALAGLGTIGLASAGAGLGTSAYFNDTESFDNNSLTAGQLDLAVQAEVYEYQGQANSGGQSFGPEVRNGDTSPTIRQQLTDVKPGDYSYGKFCFSIVDNPGYIWAGGELTASDENAVTEPEADASGENNSETTDDLDGDGELADAIEVTLFCVDHDYDPSEQSRPSTSSFSDVVAQGSLREVLAQLQTGIPLDADPSTDGRDAFQGSTSQSAGFDNGDKCLAFAWEVPTSVGNEIQTDSVEFDIAFAAYQERHNDGSQQPFADATVSSDYFNPDGHANPTDGTVVTKVNFGEEIVALSFTFQDDDDGVDFLDTSDYPATNLPVMIDADDNGFTDFQLVWDPDKFNGGGTGAVGDFDSAPFAVREHDNSDGTPGSYVPLPSGYGGSKNGNTITFSVPKGVVGTQFKLSGWASTGGSGPVVEISTDSDNTPNFTSSANYVDISES